jgi:hypothetical protein
MFANESAFDRGIRIILGVVLISLVFIGPKTLWGLLGLIPLVTGAVGFCPIYRLFNVRTNAAPPPTSSRLAS